MADGVEQGARALQRLVVALHGEPKAPSPKGVGGYPLRYWMTASQDLTAKDHTIICTTIAQYYVN